LSKHIYFFLFLLSALSLNFLVVIRILLIFKKSFTSITSLSLTTSSFLTWRHTRVQKV